MAKTQQTTRPLEPAGESGTVPHTASSAPQCKPNSTPHRLRNPPHREHNTTTCPSRCCSTQPAASRSRSCRSKQNSRVLPETPHTSARTTSHACPLHSKQAHVRPLHNNSSSIAGHLRTCNHKAIAGCHKATYLVQAAFGMSASRCKVVNIRSPAPATTGLPTHSTECLLHLQTMPHTLWHVLKSDSTWMCLISLLHTQCTPTLEMNPCAD